MGRPLRWDTIEGMNIVTSKGQLSKQVGYNKYRIKNNDELIVRLAEQEVEDNDVVITLTDGANSAPVLKIMNHLFQTPMGAYEYSLNEDGEIVFAKEGVEISGGEPTPVNYTFTIEATPASANVTINGQSQTSLTASAGTEITWSVEKTGYVSQNGSYTLNDNHTETVTLVEEQQEEPAGE